MDIKIIKVTVAALTVTERSNNLMRENVRRKKNQISLLFMKRN